MAFTEDDDVIKALATHTPEEALDERVHRGRSYGGLQNTHSGSHGNAGEYGAELAIAVG